MKWDAYFKKGKLDDAALRELAQERFPARRTEIAVRILAVFHKHFKTEGKSLIAKARLVDDLGFDDMDFIEMLRIIEKELSIQFDAEDLQNGATLEDLIECAERKSVHPSH